MRVLVDVLGAEQQDLALASLHVGMSVGARRWPYTAAHPDCWQMPWRGEVLSRLDARAWEGPALAPSKTDAECVTRHVAWCYSQGLLRDTIPVLWFFENEQRVRWEQIGAGSCVKAYADDVSEWVAARDAAYRRLWLEQLAAIGSNKSNSANRACTEQALAA